MGDNFLDLEEPEQGSGEEKLILGKFKSQEELAKAYSELEPEFTRRSQELAETKRLLTEAQSRPQVPVQAEPEEDDNELFFRSPAQAVEKVVRKLLDPLVSNGYEQEKEKLRSDPEFVKYEPEIDGIVNNMPHLKTQHGIVNQLFKMVKGVHFDEVEYEKRVREKIKSEGAVKTEGSLEAASGAELPRGTRQVELTAEEKRVAVRFNPGIPKEEAYKKYSEKKAKFGGGA